MSLIKVLPKVVFVNVVFVLCIDNSWRCRSQFNYTICGDRFLYASNLFKKLGQVKNNTNWHKVYRDSEPQCIMGRQIGQLPPLCMLSCRTRACIAYIFVWVQQRPLLIFSYSRYVPYRPGVSKKRRIGRLYIYICFLSKVASKPSILIQIGHQFSLKLQVLKKIVN